MASGYGDGKEMFEGDVSVGTLDVLFTPCGGGRAAVAEARRLDFSGFQGEGQSQGEKMIRRRMYCNAPSTAGGPTQPLYLGQARVEQKEV